MDDRTHEYKNKNSDGDGSKDKYVERWCASVILQDATQYIWHAMIKKERYYEHSNVMYALYGILGMQHSLTSVFFTVYLLDRYSALS